MKRIFCLVITIVTVLSLVGCGGGNGVTDESVEPSQQPERDELEAVGDVDVDAGLFNVTLTIPADFVDEGMTQEYLDKEAKENGYKSATLNGDGSVTYVMSKAQHKEMVDEIRANIDETLAGMVSSGDYPTIVRIKANEDYTQYKVFLNTEEVGLEEGYVVLGLYMCSGMFHIFNGTKAGNINIQYVSEMTGNIIQEANSDDVQ